MNDYTRYLCHKKSENPASQKDAERYASGSSFDNTEPDKTTTSKIVESVTDFTKRKALANRLWYQKNKDWKHDYNANYYQANKEYWQRRYREALADRRQAHRLIDDQVNAYNRNVICTTRMPMRLIALVALSSVIRPRQECPTLIQKRPND